MSVAWVGEDVHMYPTGPLVGAARLPGSKSLTNRFLTCAALADGLSHLRGASLADDALALTDGLAALGVRCETISGAHELIVHGCRGHLPADEAGLNVGHAGTAMRFLTALACLGHGRYTLDGSARMRERPIGELVAALNNLGATIGYVDRDGFPPLNVLAKGLDGGRVRIERPPSSQFVSALLMVAPYARRDVMLELTGPLVSRPYVDMTLDVMRALGVEAIADDEAQRFVIPAFQRYQPGQFDVEPDASAASYMWSAAALTGGRIRTLGLTRRSRQGDVGFVDVLGAMGCVVEEDAEGLAVGAPADGRLRGITVDLNAMPDTAQTLAVVALFAEGPTTITNVANLRVKETDRLAALETELSRLGGRVELREDGLTLHPPTSISAATVATYDDHRMAMSFALAGLVAEGVVVGRAGCVSKSFPDYFDVLGSLS